MSQTAEAKDQTLLGGWTPYHDLSTEDKKVFDEATHNLLGVKYTPKKVSTQLVNGTNYRFMCSASMPPSNAVWEAIISIYKPLTGAPYITGIQRI